MKPKILEFAVDQMEYKAPTYKYDFHRSLNVVNINGEIQPFILSSPEAAKQGTSTRVRREQDDHKIHLETASKTKVQRESDDLSAYLALKTKTFTKNERDD